MVSEATLPSHAHLAHFLNEFGNNQITHHFSEDVASELGEAVAQDEQTLRQYLAEYIGWPMTISLDHDAKVITITVHDMPVEWTDMITVVI